MNSRPIHRIQAFKVEEAVREIGSVGSTMYMRLLDCQAVATATAPVAQWQTGKKHDSQLTENKHF